MEQFVHRDEQAVHKIKQEIESYRNITTTNNTISRITSLRHANHRVCTAISFNPFVICFIPQICAFGTSNNSHTSSIPFSRYIHLRSVHVLLPSSLCLLSAPSLFWSLVVCLTFSIQIRIRIESHSHSLSLSPNQSFRSTFNSTPQHQQYETNRLPIPLTRFD